MRELYLRENDVPSAGVTLANLLHDRALLESAMLELDAGAAAFGDESHLDISRSLPIGGLPRQRNQMRRLKRGDTADFEFGSVGEALEESPADAPFNDDVLRAFAAERETFASGHHLPISSVNTRNATSGGRATLMALRIVIDSPPGSA